MKKPKKVHLSKVSLERGKQKNSHHWFNGAHAKSHPTSAKAAQGLKRAGDTAIADHSVMTGYAPGLDRGGDEAVFNLPHPGSVQPGTVERAPFALAQDADGQ